MQVFIRTGLLFQMEKVSETKLFGQCVNTMHSDGFVFNV